MRRRRQNKLVGGALVSSAIPLVQQAAVMSALGAGFGVARMLWTLPGVPSSVRKRHVKACLSSLFTRERLVDAPLMNTATNAVMSGINTRAAASSAGLAAAVKGDTVGAELASLVSMVRGGR